MEGGGNEEKRAAWQSEAEIKLRVGCDHDVGREATQRGDTLERQLIGGRAVNAPALVRGEPFANRPPRDHLSPVTDDHLAQRMAQTRSGEAKARAGHKR